MRKIWLRLFWWISIDPWRLWKHAIFHGLRIGIFRNRPGVIPWRYGFYFLGLELGDRGGRRRRLLGSDGRLWWFGPKIKRLVWRDGEVSLEAASDEEAKKTWEEYRRYLDSGAGLENGSLSMKVSNLTKKQA